MRSKLLVSALLVLTMPAVADDRPLIRPTRDVVVEYRSVGPAHGSTADPGRLVTMRFASKTGRVRLDGPNGRGFAIFDVSAGRMIVVMAEHKIYMEQPADPAMVEMFQAKDSAFTKSGTDTVAGVGCTTYDVMIRDRKGQVCLTDDGVLLRARGDDPDHQRVLEALTVTYEAQPNVLFGVPAGFQKLDPSSMPHGMAGPPGGQPGR